MGLTRWQPANWLVTHLCSWVCAWRGLEGQAAGGHHLPSPGPTSAQLDQLPQRPPPVQGGWRGGERCFPGTPFLQAQSGEQPGSPRSVCAPQVGQRLWDTSCFVVTSTAGPGSCPGVLHPCLSQGKSICRTVSLSQPRGDRGSQPTDPASLPLPTSLTCFPSLGLLSYHRWAAGLQRSKVNKNTSLQGGQRAAGLRAEVPAVCRKAFQRGCSQCSPG